MAAQEQHHSALKQNLSNKLNSHIMPKYSLSISALLNIVLSLGVADGSTFANPASYKHPEPIKRYRVGIVDNQGKSIVPCNYKTIENLGFGFYFLEKFSKHSTQENSYEGLIVNHLGKVVSPPLPPDTTLAGALILKTPEPETKLSVLPDQTFLIIHSDKGFGLADHTGKVILNAEHLKIGQPNQHYFPVDATETEKFVFNTQTNEKLPFPAEYKIVEGTGKFTQRKLVPIAMSKGRPARFGYARASGYVLIPPVYNEAGEFDDADYALVRVGEKKGFVDDLGQLASPLYQKASPFHGQYAVIYKEEEHVSLPSKVGETGQCILGLPSGKAALVDKTFKLHLYAKYKSLRYLRDDIYAAELMNGSGMDAITPQDELVFHFPENTHNLHILKDGYLCMRHDKYLQKLDDITIDNHGNPAPPAQTSDAEPLSGLTVIHNTNGDGVERSSVVDASGKIVAKEIVGTYQIIDKDRIIKTVPK